MNKEMQIFKNEEFGQVRVVMVGSEPYFVGKDVAEVLGYKRTTKAIQDHVDEEDKILLDKTQSQNGIQLDYKILGQRGGYIISESGLFGLILNSEIPSAKKFKRWVTSDVLPTIRKTGGYVANDDMFIDIYLPFADDQTKLLFRSTLSTVRSQNEIINTQKKEIEHKSSVIEGLVEDVDLATKRQRINQIIKYNSIGNIGKRWGLLYSEFEKKYHMNIKKRMENCDIKPKIKSKVDYIDRVLEMIPELYELACKVFETDIEKLKLEWEQTIKRQ